MHNLHHILLDDRGLVALTGADAREFLQGLITNDAHLVGERRAVYAALLTPQGKFLHDFFIFQLGESLMLDCAAARREDLMRRLGIYKLRADVDIADASDRYAVCALIGDGAAEAVGLADEAGAATPCHGGIACVDPRHAGIGVRMVLPVGEVGGIGTAAGSTPADAAEYVRLCMGLGVPDGSRDLEIERSLPLEFGFDDLNAVDFDKGCFIGQEVTSRMKRRGLVRKRLMPVTFDGAAPPIGAVVMRGDVEAGEIRAVDQGIGLALLRLDRIAPPGPDLVAAGTRLAPRKPDWMMF